MRTELSLNRSQRVGSWLRRSAGIALFGELGFVTFQHTVKRDGTSQRGNVTIDWDPIGQLDGHPTAINWSQDDEDGADLGCLPQ